MKATTYAKRSHSRMIRRKMTETIAKEVSKVTLKELTGKLINETISAEIEKQSKPIYPIQNCIIRKVKSIKRPRVDITQLLSMHTGAPVQQQQQKEETSTEEKGPENLIAA
jgi:small subunit ribosomal protein S3Ae